MTTFFKDKESSVMHIVFILFSISLFICEGPHPPIWACFPQYLEFLVPSSNTTEDQCWLLVIYLDCSLNICASMSFYGLKVSDEPSMSPSISARTFLIDSNIVLSVREFSKCISVSLIQILHLRCLRKFQKKCKNMTRGMMKPRQFVVSKYTIFFAVSKPI